MGDRHPLKPLEVQAKKAEADVKIGTLAERTGTTVATIRYYEQTGLLRVPARSGGQRVYDHEDLRRLAFIRRCRDYDLSIEEIGTLLSLLHDRASCTEARKLAERHLAGVRRRLAELLALERTLATLVQECAGTCDGGAAADCVILRTQ